MSVTRYYTAMRSPCLMSSLHFPDEESHAISRRDDMRERSGAAWPGTDLACVTCAPALSEQCRFECPGSLFSGGCQIAGCRFSVRRQPLRARDLFGTCSGRADPETRTGANCAHGHERRAMGDDRSQSRATCWIRSASAGRFRDRLSNSFWPARPCRRIASMAWKASSARLTPSGSSR
jgi:hypothetical protein